MPAPRSSGTRGREIQERQQAAWRRIGGRSSECSWSGGVGFHDFLKSRVGQVTEKVQPPVLGLNGGGLATTSERKKTSLKAGSIFW